MLARMTNPLAPYFHCTPTPETFADVPTDELRRIIDAARNAERLDVTDLRETRHWAETTRKAAEEVLAKRHAR